MSEKNIISCSVFSIHPFYGKTFRFIPKLRLEFTCLLPQHCLSSHREFSAKGMKFRIFSGVNSCD